MEEREASYTVGGNVNWCNYYGKQKVKTELPYDPAIPLLGIYLRKMKTLTRKDICTPMFTAALITIAKIWKQCKWPLMDK